MKSGSRPTPVYHRLLYSACRGQALPAYVIDIYRCVLTGSRFSPESALAGPSTMGSDGTSGTISGASLKPGQWPGNSLWCELAYPPSRKGHLSAGDRMRPASAAISIANASQAPAGSFSLDQQNSVPSLHMRCMITARRRASATMAFCRPRRLATLIAHAFSHDHFATRLRRTCAAS